MSPSSHRRSSRAPLPLAPEGGGGRFPDFNVLAQAPHWDDATRAVIDARLDTNSPLRFFDESQRGTVSCLLDQLVGQEAGPHDTRVDLLAMVDARLADGQTDGWRYDTMPHDADAWRRSVDALNSDARARFDADFDACPPPSQRELLESIRTSQEDHWHGLPPAELWGLWTRYAATAFYAHPLVWNEIGFAGPAYPRGYKNIGIDRREPFEVADARPADDPLRESRGPGPERAK